MKRFGRPNLLNRPLFRNCDYSISLVSLLTLPYAQCVRCDRRRIRSWYEFWNRQVYLSSCYVITVSLTVSVNAVTRTKYACYADTDSLSTPSLTKLTKLAMIDLYWTIRFRYRVSGLALRGPKSRPNHEVHTTNKTRPSATLGRGASGQLALLD